MSPYRRPSSNPSPNTKLHLPLLPRTALTRLALAGLALAGSTLACSSETSPQFPYAGQQTRQIKALSASQIKDLRAGAGMGYAKVAELNGFPGPKHVLELDDSLRLTENQRSETERIFTRMRKHAQGAGRVRFQR